MSGQVKTQLQLQQQLAQLACMTPCLSIACMVLGLPSLSSHVSSLLEILLLILSRSLF